MKTTRFDPGKLRQFISIRQASQTVDDRGGVTDIWTEVLAGWAALKPLRANAPERARAPEQEVTHRAFMRFDDRVQAGMQMALGERVMRIVALYDPDETQRYITLILREETELPR